MKIASNKNGHVEIVINSKSYQYSNSIEWKIIPIDTDIYIIQNRGTHKFMEINNNYLQCTNNISAPYIKDQINSKFLFKITKLYEEVEIKPNHIKIIDNEPIDVVIKYIDLLDKTLKRDKIRQIKKDEDNEELRYSVRSIVQYIPWIRKIFILMPNEKVRYFKAYDEIKHKIVYVKDKDVLGYDSANIYAFTFNLWRMEKFGLSNNFIYMDDDFFIGGHLNKSNFFYYDENINKVVPSLLNIDFCELGREETIKNYNRIFAQKDELVEQGYMAWVLSLYSSEKFFVDHYKNITLINPKPTHNAISYNIQDLKEIYELVVNNYQYANETLNSIHRHILTLQTQHFVDLFGINVKNRKVHSIKCGVVPLNLIKMSNLYTSLFVINLGGDRIYSRAELKRQTKIMEQRFPNPTPYETIYDLAKQTKTGEKNGKDDENRENFVKIKKNQSFRIDICTVLIIGMIIIIFILLYLYINERNKNNILNKYSIISESKYKQNSEIIESNIVHNNI